jgi:hypothetical protein
MVQSVPVSTRTLVKVCVWKKFRVRLRKGRAVESADLYTVCSQSFRGRVQVLTASRDVYNSKSLRQSSGYRGEHVTVQLLKKITG